MALFLSVAALLIAMIAMWFASRLSETVIENIKKTNANKLAKLNDTLIEHRESQAKAEEKLLNTIKELESRLDNEILKMSQITQASDPDPDEKRDGG